MTLKRYSELQEALLNFVIRASGEDASAEEVQALAAVARVLVETFR